MTEIDKETENIEHISCNESDLTLVKVAAQGGVENFTSNGEKEEISAVKSDNELDSNVETNSEIDDTVIVWKQKAESILPSNESCSPDLSKPEESEKKNESKSNNETKQENISAEDMIEKNGAADESAVAEENFDDKYAELKAVKKDVVAGVSEILPETVLKDISSAEEEKTKATM